MPKPSRADQLNHAIEAVLGLPAQAPASLDPGLAPLLDIARELHLLPRDSFKLRLKSELEKRSMTAISETITPARRTATPRMRIKNAAAAIDFYKKAFGARELMRFVAHGEVAHAEIAIGNSVVMLGEEAPEYGFPGPQTLGGSPVGMHLDVEDVDAFVERAVAAGARIVSPVSDQFYGDRSGTVADPFGYTWMIATRLHEMSVDEMQRNFAAMEREQQESRTATSFIPEGFHTVTPYIIVDNAPALIEFARNVFDAGEISRSIGSAGGVHAEVRIGGSMLMMGGGAPDLSWRGDLRLTALHIYVPDTDAAYRRALDAGALSIQPPTEQPYGERGASIKDRFGNYWYIATAHGDTYIPEGLAAVNAYLHPLRAEPVINFLKRGLGATEMDRYASPDGVIHHARIRLGDSVIEMGEAHGPYQPMPATFYLYVPDVDATYLRCMNAGAESLGRPADQPYGDRTAAVKDVFGNEWYLATQIKSR